MQKDHKLIDVFQKYVKLTPEKSIIKIIEVRLSDFNFKGKNNRTYISTRSIKHVYDKRPAEEFDRCILILNEIIKNPTEVYDNLSKEGKRGSILLSYKDVYGQRYVCSLEESDEPAAYKVVTFFRIRKENYLNGYKLIWSQEGGTPLS